MMEIFNPIDPRTKKPWINTSEPIKKQDVPVLGSPTWEPKVPRDTVTWFAELMESKLKLDDNKPNWEAEDIRIMWNDLEEEKQELFTAVFNYQNDDSPRNAAKVIQESIDLANFAMFIASLVDTRKSKNARGHLLDKESDFDKEMTENYLGHLKTKEGS
jgi:hypothetical protein